MRRQLMWDVMLGGRNRRWPHFPEECPLDMWVYQIFDDGILVYVGSTKNLKNRLRNHPVYDKRFPFQTVDFDACWNAYEQEMALIHEHHPPLNQSTSSQERYRSGCWKDILNV